MANSVAVLSPKLYGILWYETLISNPDLPRPGGREISHFSVKQSEIWVRD